LYLILRTQTLHPWNPNGFHSGTWDVSFNTVSSFLTNTNWQYYGGETTMTYFSQMAGLAVQNFVSAAIGIVVVIALIRGIATRSGRSIGNFWQDLIRCTLYVLLPIAIIGAVVLISQGVVQNFSDYTSAHTVLGATQSIAQGPVASQEVIKELGTNGGGFFNVNSAHPFENPNAFTNLLEMLFILMIPASLTYTYGRMVGSRRQGWAIFAAMSVLFVAGVAVVYAAEHHGTPAQHLVGLTGGNMEGKEQRFGVFNSSLWTAVTTVTSCGAVNAGLESLTGLGGAVPMANLALSETVFGGVGTGLYSMLIYVILAVFLGGLMVGRTPEFLGKKIGGREMKLATLFALFTPLVALMTSASAIAAPAGKKSISAAGPQGFSENLYAYLSQANNNGSAWAGYTGYVQPNPGNLGAHGVTFADLLGGLTMMFARYAPIIFALALAGSLVGKKVAPAGLGTLRTDSGTFVVLLIGVVVLVGALTFLPAILLGPIVQSLTTQVF
ncbi:MAG TPA: potassium-transporting ATPase subunit KdpA, partial [Thermoleophilaceae bacterium]|nr:potassium-transporting ATPase subunit KdpA [Thermoleophilaceae bacterium]